MIDPFASLSVLWKGLELGCGVPGGEQSCLLASVGLLRLDMHNKNILTSSSLFNYLDMLCTGSSEASPLFPVLSLGENLSDCLNLVFLK